jgi:pimeloyl-ACP methyl ester carboxylesterase
MSSTTVDLQTAVSKDGTIIGYSRLGKGPALVLVDGAMCYRAFGPIGTLAGALSPHFTVYTYDRRGRGASGDTLPYTVSREIEDIEAVIACAGGSACVYGISSGAALALKAAAGSNLIERLAIYEPPFVAGMAEYGVRLQELLAAGHRGDAVELFLRTVGTPPQAITGMRAAPVWQLMEGIAPTLAYDSEILADGSVPVEHAGKVKVPALVMAGGASPETLRVATRAAASAIPHARLRILDDQTHDVSPGALAPVLTDFFLSRGAR